VRIEGVEARLENASGGLVWGPHTIPATGFIDPSSGTSPSYGVVDATLVGADFGAKMATQLAADASRSGRHYTSISKVFGHTLGNQAVDSGEFHFPITICFGCLIYYPAEANDPKVAPNPNCDLPQSTGTALAVGCTPGQDEMVDCRVCKATYPTFSGGYVRWPFCREARAGNLGPMERRTVQLRVAGQTYRVVTTASDADLKRLVSTLEEKLTEVSPRGRSINPQAILLAALALIHDLEEERGRARRIEGRAKEALGRLLTRIDAALQEDAGGAPPIAPSP